MHAFRRLSSPSCNSKLLEFRLNGESGEPCCAAVFDVPTTELEITVVSFEGRDSKSPFLYLLDLHVVFDTRTGVFYEILHFFIALVSNVVVQ